MNSTAQRLLFPPPIPESLGHFWLARHAVLYNPKNPPCDVCRDPKTPEMGLSWLDDGSRICWHCLWAMWSERHKVTLDEYLYGPERTQ